MLHAEQYFIYTAPLVSLIYLYIVTTKIDGQFLVTVIIIKENVLTNMHDFEQNFRNLSNFHKY